jgi:hypothetical protein
MFNILPRQPVLMNPKQTSFFIILILAGLLAFSGCTATTGPTPQAAVMTPEPLTPVKTTTLITPLPANEIARIKVDHFGMNPSTESIYEFVGKTQVNGGPYQSVQVILRYPDSQEYTYDLGGMGGSNATIKPFSLFPADRYKGTNPEKIIALDSKQYGTVYRNENMVDFWIAKADNMISP